MSLINWLSQKPSAKPVPNAAAGEPANASTGGPDSKPSSSRRAERAERREQLYAVVRHAMASAGVLTASYKFKVLSLDSKGASFLVMMDLASQAAEDPARMAEIEAVIAHNAKTRFEIVVAAVYWRLSDYVAAGLSNRQAQGQGAVRSPAPATHAAQRVDPVGAEEVLAFKNAFAAQGRGAPLYASGEIQKSGKRTPSAPVPADRVDGPDADDRISPLGPTQYGDLN